MLDIIMNWTPIPPGTSGSIPDQVWTEAASILPVNVAGYFTGPGLSFALAPSSAALPTGVTISSLGIIEGTPAESFLAPRSIVLRATNAGGHVDLAFSLTVNPVAAGGDITLLRGDAVNIVAPTYMAAGSGDYTSLDVPPLGVVLNPVTGALTGYALAAGPATSFTVSRAGVADYTRTIEVRMKSNLPAPKYPIFNLDVDAVPGWTTDVVVAAGASADADRTALIAAINTAYGQSGTATVPKFHRITYRGRHLDECTGEKRILPAHISAANGAHNYLLIVGDHVTDSRTKGQICFGKAATYWANWLFHGAGASGAYAITTTNSPIGLASGVSCGYKDCQFGAWFVGKVPRFIGPTEYAVAMIDARGGSKFAFEACEVAGAGQLMNTRGGQVFSIDTYGHDLLEDIFFLTTRDAELDVYSIGHVSHRQLQFTDQLNASPPHDDGGVQTGDPLDVYPYRSMQLYDHIAIPDSTHYGGTGIRMQEVSSTPGNGQHIDLDIENAILLTSGWTLIKLSQRNQRLHNIIGLPAPGIGACGSGNLGGGLWLENDVYGTHVYDVRNICYGRWTRSPAPVVSGTELQVDVHDSSIQTAFPNFSGVLQWKTQQTNFPPTTSYVPNDADNVYTFVPDPLGEGRSRKAVREALSVALLRGTDWDDPANDIIGDPALWGVYPETFTSAGKPVLSGLAVDGGAQTATISADQDGIIFAFVSTIDDVPVADYVKHATLKKGRGKSYYVGKLVNEIPDQGRAVISAGSGISVPITWSNLPASTNLYLYVAMEGETGEMSALAKAGPFQI